MKCLFHWSILIFISASETRFLLIRLPKMGKLALGFCPTHYSSWVNLFNGANYLIHMTHRCWMYYLCIESSLAHKILGQLKNHKLKSNFNLKSCHFCSFAWRGSRGNLLNWEEFFFEILPSCYCSLVQMSNIDNQANKKRTLLWMCQIQSLINMCSRHNIHTIMN